MKVIERVRKGEEGVYAAARVRKELGLATAERFTTNPH
jgi:hypothetical protein